jgi:hypothetical protein
MNGRRFKVTNPFVYAFGVVLLAWHAEHGSMWWAVYCALVIGVFVVLDVRKWARTVPVDPPYADTSRLDHLDGVS